ncbi:hypothetical protein N7451_010398 [Penicillium sp. IBT 35674x]|nr:hypothetical protein N7451_010398 [Penicillium sp. IBT 35674x]
MTVPSMRACVVFAGPFYSSFSGSYVQNIGPSSKSPIFLNCFQLICCLLEIHADYMLQRIDQYQTDNIPSFASRLSAS